MISELLKFHLMLMLIVMDSPLSDSCFKKGKTFPPELSLCLKFTAVVLAGAVSS